MGIPKILALETCRPAEPPVHSRNEMMSRLTINPNPIVVSPRYIPSILSAGKPIINPKHPTIKGVINNDNSNGIPTWSTRIADV